MRNPCRRRAVLGLCLSLMCFAYQPTDGSEQGQTGRLTVLVTDQLGNRVSAKVSITSVSRKRPLEVQSGHKVVLEYGVYRISAYAPGFREEEKRVKVFASDVLAVLSLPLGWISPESYTVLEGTVQGLPSQYAQKGMCYVKVIPVFGQVTQEAVIAADGRFRLKECDGGEHVIVVVCQGNVLSVKPVKLIKSHEAIEIDLQE